MFEVITEFIFSIRLVVVFLIGYWNWDPETNAVHELEPIGTQGSFNNT